MTCTGCLHQDYCAYYGCPFMREPQSEFDFPKQTKEVPERKAHSPYITLYDLENRFDDEARDHDACNEIAGSPKFRPAGGMPATEFNARWSSPEARQAHNLEVVSSNLTCATKFTSGVGPGHHQPRSNDRGRARDRAIGPADSRNSSRGVVEGHERYATPACHSFSCRDRRNGKLAPNAKLVAGIKPGPRETIHIREHQVTDDDHHVRSAIVNSNQFGCVNTGPNPQSMTGRKASTKSGPQSQFWIVRCDVTAAANSQVAA